MLTRVLISCPINYAGYLNLLSKIYYSQLRDNVDHNSLVEYIQTKSEVVHESIKALPVLTSHQLNAPGIHDYLAILGQSFCILIEASYLTADLKSHVYDLSGVVDSFTKLLNVSSADYSSHLIKGILDFYRQTLNRTETDLTIDESLSLNDVDTKLTEFIFSIVKVKLEDSIIMFNERNNRFDLQTSCDLMAIFYRLNKSSNSDLLLIWKNLLEASEAETEFE